MSAEACVIAIMAATLLGYLIGSRLEARRALARIGYLQRRIDDLEALWRSERKKVQNLMDRVE